MTKLNICGRRTGQLVLTDIKAQWQHEEQETGRTSKFKRYLKEYCREGSLHGLKYFVENRTFVEKLWWALSMVICLFLCLSLMVNTHLKWENSPVIVSFATRETPNIKIPFPTVTICPETKSLPRIFNYTYYYDMLREDIALGPDTEKKFGYLSLICNYKPEVNYDAFGEKYAGDDVFEFFDEVSPKISDVMSECKYMGETLNCSDIFFPVVTDEGVCFTFNLLDRSQLLRDDVAHYKNYQTAPMLSNWTLQDGYAVWDPLVTYPRRALFSGTSFALEAKLTTYEEDQDYVCGTSIQGYKIQLSQPAEMPRVREHHFRIPLDEFTIAAITLDVTTTSASLKSYDPLKRNCYFSDEKSLKYFKVYSQESCQIECKTNYTLERCGCVDFYMPRFNGTKVCTGSNIRCTHDAERELLLEWMNSKLLLLNEGNTVKDKCDCLPLCTSMSYNVETSQSKFNWKRQYDSENRTKYMSYLRVYFKNSQFITMDRNELFGITECLANFGGLLGLFVGFSTLSLIEIIYYLTLRIVCNIKLFGRRYWHGKPDQD